MIPAIAFFGRNILTGAAITSISSDVHVASLTGEESVPRKVPMSFNPSIYVKMRSVTWTNWGQDQAEGYARVSSNYPSNGPFSGQSGWVHMRLSCPVEQYDGFIYFSRYDVTWLTDPPETGVDGWEEGGEFSVFEGPCGAEQAN